MITRYKKRLRNFGLHNLNHLNKLLSFPHYEITSDKAYNAFEWCAHNVSANDWIWCTLDGTLGNFWAETSAEKEKLLKFVSEIDGYTRIHFFFKRKDDLVSFKLKFI